MSVEADLNYDPATLLHPFSAQSVTNFEKWLHDSGYLNIHFEKQYLDHVRRFQGGVPGKRHFQTTKGTKHVIERFLNFLPKGADPVMEQFNVESVWCALSDRMGLYLMPFAELAFGDELCFNFEHPGRPQIVVWFHELSRPDQPYFEVVSDTFDDFLSMLADGG